ncbi:hypothetical protein C8J56DRAFT_1158391 [Mycena floridula]|nr:hypothetical protein C8J56DRAFT_1158391 [Mycena floridula]
MASSLSVPAVASPAASAGSFNFPEDGNISEGNWDASSLGGPQTLKDSDAEAVTARSSTQIMTQCLELLQAALQTGAGLGEEWPLAELQSEYESLSARLRGFTEQLDSEVDGDELRQLERDIQQFSSRVNVSRYVSEVEVTRETVGLEEDDCGVETEDAEMEPVDETVVFELSSPVVHDVNMTEGEL